MKQKFGLLILIAALLLPCTVAHANSLPGRWDYGESGGVVFVLAGENLAVEHEDLSFLIPENGGGMLPAAKVSARYRIRNSGEPRKVTMLFPILFSPEDARSIADDLNVLVDSKPEDFSFTLLDSISGAYAGSMEIQALRQRCTIENILAQMQEKGITEGEFVPSEFAQRYFELYPDYDYSSRLLLVMYDVEFSAGQTRDVEVQYAQRATSFTYDEPKFFHSQFYYLLSPAKTFEQFGTLDITIDVDKPDTDLSAPGFAFAPVDGAYRLSCDGLPGQDLFFMLEHDSRTWFDMHPFLTFLLKIVVAAAIGIPIAIAIFGLFVKMANAVQRIFSNRRQDK